MKENGGELIVNINDLNKEPMVQIINSIYIKKNINKKKKYEREEGSFKEGIKEFGG